VPVDMQQEGEPVVTQQAIRTRNRSKEPFR